MHQETDSEAGLVRAADLIGQLADPFYPRKLNALFHEFEEIGVNTKLGYKTPADIADHYPRFFWTKVEPFVRDAMRYLALTVRGRQWTANLYTHVMNVLPVKFRPGRARLSTMPNATGSPLIANRTVRFAVTLIASIAGPLETSRSAGTVMISGSIARTASGLPGA